LALDIKIGRGILFGIIMGVGYLYGKHKCHKRHEFPHHAHAMFRHPHMFRKINGLRLMDEAGKAAIIGFGIGVGAEL
jgi:hypothetical protein